MASSKHKNDANVFAFCFPRRYSMIAFSQRKCVPGHAVPDAPGAASRSSSALESECFMNEKPEVSIIIAVYQAESFLEACLRSIAVQSFRNFEAICIDDCSADRSGEILDRFAASDPRFRIMHNSARIGGGASRNQAMREARGRFVYFMDPDDLLHPRMLECTLHFANKECADAVAFGFRKNDPWPSDAPLSSSPDELPYRIDTEPFYKMGCAGQFRITYTYWSKLYRRSALDGVDFLEGRPGNPHVLSDFYHTACALRQVHRCVVLREPLYSYTRRAGSETRSPIGSAQIGNYRMAVNNLADRLGADRSARIRRHLRDYPVSSVVRGQLRRIERLHRTDPGACAEAEEAFREELADFRQRGLLGNPGWRLRHWAEWLRIYRRLIA